MLLTDIDQVLISTSEHMSRLKAARVQADIMNTELIIVARTDALSAKLIDNNSDIIDQPYILGVSEDAGKELVTYVEAGVRKIKKSFSGPTREKVIVK